MTHFDELVDVILPFAYRAMAYKSRLTRHPTFAAPSPTADPDLSLELESQCRSPQSKPSSSMCSAR
jgi:hypothetical protein